MGYVEKNLLKDEVIKYEAFIHWAAFLLPGIFWSLIALIGSSLSDDEDYVIVIIILWVFAAFRLCKGLIYKFSTECVLTNSRLVFKFGFISRQATELQLIKCEGASVYQSMLGRLLGYGTIAVTTGGVTNKVAYVANPIAFRNCINEQIDLVHAATSSHDSVVDAAPIQSKKSVVEEIKELSELLKQGVITEEEFKTMKSKIINRN